MTVECLKNALALIENYFGRPLSTDERTARSQIYAAALKDIPDDVAAAALTKALTVCRYQNQLLVDWCAEIRKLQSAGQPTANDLWTQAIVAARKIERNQYYYQTSRDYKVLMNGKLSKRYIVTDAGPINSMTASCGSFCGAYWEHEEFDISEDGMFYDKKYLEEEVST